MKRKSIGLNGVNCVIQRIEKEWTLETFMLSILPCKTSMAADPWKPLSIFQSI